MSYLTLANVFWPRPQTYDFDYQSNIGKIRKFLFDYENPYSRTPLLYMCIYIYTDVVRIVGTLGKYDQSRVW